jgi:hypothetical protein
VDDLEEEADEEADDQGDADHAEGKEAGDAFGGVLLDAGEGLRRRGDGLGGLRLASIPLRSGGGSGFVSINWGKDLWRSPGGRFPRPFPRKKFS